MVTKCTVPVRKKVLSDQEVFRNLRLAKGFAGPVTNNQPPINLRYTTLMETKQDYSYGVLPLLLTDEGVKVFLIHQYGYSGDIYWTFPKGHAEAGEDPRQAALRELREETGLEVQSLVEGVSYTQHYSFKVQNELIEKTVEFFVGYAVSSVYTLQEDEVKEAGWFSYEEALQKLTFEPSKKILKEAAGDFAL